MRVNALIMYPVSIHASVKDATKMSKRLGNAVDPCFNPRIRKGCDGVTSDTLVSKLGFNPRIRKGCDFLIR